MNADSIPSVSATVASTLSAQHRPSSNLCAAASRFLFIWCFLSGYNSLITGPAFLGTVNFQVGVKMLDLLEAERHATPQQFKRHHL
ncbi:MAG: hypothetical protein WA151_03275 [Desulfatirhabdiaceae bacterium]